MVVAELEPSSTELADTVIVPPRPAAFPSEVKAPAIGIDTTPVVETVIFPPAPAALALATIAPDEVILPDPDWTTIFAPAELIAGELMLPEERAPRSGVIDPEVIAPLLTVMLPEVRPAA